MKTWVSVAGVVAGIGALGFGALWVAQDSIFYVPDTTDAGSATALDPRGTDVELLTGDGLELRAWRFDPPTDGKMAVLYLPGNGGNRAGRVSVAHALVAEGFTTVLLDYRGFGGNPGKPGEAGLLLDAMAAYSYLEDSGFAPEEIYVIGESLGTSVAISLANRVDPAGVLLRSPFTSLPDVAKRITKVPVGWLLKDQFDSISRIGGVNTPVVILAGGADDLVPAAQSEELARFAPHLASYVELPGVGHNDEVWFGAFLADQLSSLVREV